MTSTHRLQASFTQSLGKEFPTIPGLKTLVFFGTGGDAFEDNRAAGGPPLTVLQGTPVHGTNYVTVGFQSAASRNDCIGTQNPRDASWIASGWTGMACVRNTSGSGATYSAVISDQNSASASPGQPGNIMGFGLQAGTNRFIGFINGIANRSNIQLTQSAANWHIGGFTTPANGVIGSMHTMWEFTEVPAGQSVQGAMIGNLTVSVPASSPHFGAHSTESSTGQGSVDIAWGMIAQAVLSQATMAAIAASARQWLGRRGIVC